jgi:hypothetical protein
MNLNTISLPFGRARPIKTHRNYVFLGILGEKKKPQISLHKWKHVPRTYPNGSEHFGL